MKLPKKLLLTFFRVLVILVIVSLAFPLPLKAPEANADTSFIGRSGTQLTLNGQPYRFTGVNAYQLGTLWGTNAGCGSQVDDLDGFFKNLAPNSVVRMWAFQGSIGTNVQTKQLDFTALDRAVSAASRNNQRVILVLGGQSGTCDDGHWKGSEWYLGGYTKSYNDDGRGLVPLPYLEYVRQVVTRYKDNPTIAMWEPVSEPEASDCAPGYTGDACYHHDTCVDQDQAAAALRNFFDVVGGEIKRIDPNHLVESGFIGASQCGVLDHRYTLVHQSPGVDIASFHDYGEDTRAMPGDVWNGLQTRLNQMKTISKPLIIGEAGINAVTTGSGCVTLTTRRDQLKAKMDTQFKAGIAGFLPWNWQKTAATNCNHDFTSNDPVISLVRNYSLSSVTPTPSQTVLSAGDTKLGGMNLNGYCSSLGLPAPTLSTGNWTCGSTGQNINMSSVCIWQYKKSDAYAKQDIQGNQYSWTCYDPADATPTPQATITSTPAPTKLGGIDLQSVCRNQNLPSPVVSGSTWTCGSGGTAINMTSACQSQFKSSSAYAKQEIAGNPYTWTCYK